MNPSGDQRKDSTVLFDFENPLADNRTLSGQDPAEVDFESYRGANFSEYHEEHKRSGGGGFRLVGATYERPLWIQTKIKDENIARLQHMERYSHLRIWTILDDTHRRDEHPPRRLKLRLRVVDRHGEIWAHQKPYVADKSLPSFTHGEYRLALKPSEFAHVDSGNKHSPLTFVGIQQLQFYLEVEYEKPPPGVDSPDKPLAVFGLYMDDIELFNENSAGSSDAILAKTIAGGVGSTWQNESFPKPFRDPPAIIASTQALLDPDPIGIRFRAIGKTGMRLKLEEENSTRDGIRHPREELGYLAFPAGPIFDAKGQIIGEAGQVTAGNATKNFDEWHRQVYSRTYDNPVVFMNLSTFRGPHPSHVRLRNVGTGFFEFMIEEWDYLDGLHIAETMSYVVVESGAHQLSKDMAIQAGTSRGNTTSRTSPPWKTVKFSKKFTDIPVLVTQVQTFDGFQAVVTRNHAIDQNGFGWRLQEEKANNDKHVEETAAFLAMGPVDSEISFPDDILACDKRKPIVFQSQVLKGHLSYNGTKFRRGCGKEYKHRGDAYGFRVESHPARFSAKASGAAKLLTLRKGDCLESEDLFCDRTQGKREPEINTILEPGTYFLFVDASKAKGGDYELSLEVDTLEPYAHQTCEQPLMIGTYNQTLEGAWPEAGTPGHTSGSCGGAGPEQVYMFRTHALYDANPLYSPRFSASSSDPNVVIYLRRSPEFGEETCTDPASEIGCFREGGVGESKIEDLLLPKDSTFYLFVDSKNSLGGRYTVDLTFAKFDNREMGGACRPAKKIEAKTQILTGHLSAKAPNRSYSTCTFDRENTQYESYPEVVYQFELKEATYFKADNLSYFDADNLSSRSKVSILALRNSHCTEVTCANHWGSIRPGILPAGVYYLHIDSGNNFYSGDRYDVHVQFGDDVASACGAAQEIDPVRQTLTGKLKNKPGTAYAQGDGKACNSDLSEHVYSFEATKNLRLIANVTYGSGITLYVRKGDCRDHRLQVDCSGGYTVPDFAAYLDLDLEPGRYFLFVDFSEDEDTVTPRDFGTYSVDLEF